MSESASNDCQPPSDTSPQVEPADPDETIHSLLKISDRLVETAQELAALSARRYRPDSKQTSFLLAIKHSQDNLETDLIDFAKRAYDERRKRDVIFNDPDLFGEPAWDILLDLMHAEHRGKRVSITSACIGSAAPPTTALRWIKILESKGLIERIIDERDARRSFIRLTHAGLAKMKAYFRATRRPSFTR